MTDVRALDGLPEDEEPLLYDDPSVPSIYGSEVFLPGDESITVDGSTLDEEMLANGLANSLAVRASIAGGLWNGDFRLGPPHPDEPISDNNPLPYWRVGADQEGGVRLYWEAYGGGGRIRAEAVVGAAYEDDAFIEQVIPVHPRQRYIVPSGLYDVSGLGAGGGDLLGYVVAKPFDATGVAQNSGVIAEQGDTRAGFGHTGPYEAAYVPMLIPDVGEVTSGGTATYPTAYALVKFIFRTDSSISAQQTRYLYDAYAGPPRILSASQQFVVDALADATQNWYCPSDNSTYTGSGVGIHQFIPQHDGWIEGLSVVIDAPRATGQQSIGVWETQNNTFIGPVVEIDVDNTGDSYTSGGGSFIHATGRIDFAASQEANIVDHRDNNPRYNWFKSGMMFRVRSESTGTNPWSPVTADGCATVTFALVDDRRERNPNL